jgi:hypothetical protein
MDNKLPGEEWLPCRCIIVNPDGMMLGHDYVARTPPDSKQYVGKRGFAEKIQGKVRITLDNGITLWGDECWFMWLEEGQ